MGMSEQELRASLNRHIESGNSQSTVAKAIGLSVPTISAWRRGIYKGDNPKVQESVEAYLARKHEQAALTKLNHPFVMTTTAEQVYALARTAHLDGAMVVLTGRAGSGKTVSLKAYAKQEPSVIFVNVNVTSTKEAVLRSIHRAAGMSGSGSLHKVFDDIAEKLRGSERLIIVDEADLLSIYALEALRGIHDAAGVGIVLAGMPRLVEVLRGMHGQFEQIYSRCETHLRLEDRIDQDDAEAIIGSYIGEVDGLAKTFIECSKGNTRMMTNIVRTCCRLAERQKCKVTRDMVSAVAEKMIV